MAKMLSEMSGRQPSRVPELGVVDPELFKDTLARKVSGVTIVTSLADGQRVGITASSFTSVSLHPPCVLVCVNQKLATYQTIKATGAFAVNMLHTGQVQLGMRFAGLCPEMADRFADLETMTAVTGAPILPDALGWVDCRLRSVYDEGDHAIFVGEVLAAGAQPQGEPLLYFRRNWCTLAAGLPLNSVY